jgi:hypothetical protein
MKKRIRLHSGTGLHLAVALAIALSLGLTPNTRAQLAPGPCEILPFEDGFIIEAFKDLQDGTGIADWSGFSGSAWISPNAYNNHTGTDFSLQTGTPLYAAAAGIVTNIETKFARDQTGSTLGLGNFVQIALDSTVPNGERVDFILRPHAVGRRVERTAGKCR